MRIDIITLFPQMFQSITDFGIPSRAINKQALTIQCWNPRDFTSDNHRSVDDRPFGGGPGMVMMVEPARKAIQAARESIRNSVNVIPKVLYLSPQGKTLTQSSLRELSAEPALICLAGRYEGIDERLIRLEVDDEYSIGDYVLSGGELPAMVLIDAIARLLPDVLGHADSACQDSFANGLLDYTHYTRPEDYEGLSVPDVLLSGNHAKIARWRRKQALGRTWQRRPDLLKLQHLSPEDRQLLDEYIAEQSDQT